MKLLSFKFFLKYPNIESDHLESWHIHLADHIILLLRCQCKFKLYIIVSHVTHFSQELLLNQQHTEIWGNVHNTFSKENSIILNIM